MDKKYAIIVGVIIGIIILSVGLVGGYMYWKDQQPKNTVDTEKEEVVTPKENTETTDVVLFDWPNNNTQFETTDASTAGYYLVGDVWLKDSNPQIGSRELKIGDEGEDVKILQIVMNNFSTTNEISQLTEKISENGKFDQATQNAVSAIQKYFLSDETGIANVEFQSLVISQLGNTDNLGVQE